MHTHTHTHTDKQSGPGGGGPKIPGGDGRRGGGGAGEGGGAGGMFASGMLKFKSAGRPRPGEWNQELAIVGLLIVM